MADRVYRITQGPSGKYVIGISDSAGNWFRVGNSPEFDSAHEAERALNRVITPWVRYYDAEGKPVE